MHEKANETGSNTYKGGLVHPDAKHGPETGGKAGWQELNARLRIRVGEETGPVNAVLETGKDRKEQRRV